MSQSLRHEANRVSPEKLIFRPRTFIDSVDLPGDEGGINLRAKINGHLTGSGIIFTSPAIIRRTAYLDMGTSGAFLPSYVMNTSIGLARN